MNGAEWLVRALQAHEVPFVSVLCGNGLAPLLQAADSLGMALVSTRNEQAASYIADGYARLTGRLGVCAVSSGIAHVNALAGVLNAHFDGAPMLSIAGCSHSETLGRGGFQDMDQAALARPICRYAETVTRAGRLPHALHEAISAATSWRPGPSHLTISLDALEDEVDVPIPASPCPRAAGAPARDDLSRAAAWLAEAERPLIVSGSGPFHAGAGAALMAFAERAAIPVVTPIWDRGIANRPSRAFLGVIGSASGEPELLTRADVILLAGARVDYRVRYLEAPPLRPDARIIRLSADARELGQGVRPDLAIHSDPGAAFHGLADEWAAQGYAPHSAWLDEAHLARDAFYGGLPAMRPAGSPPPPPGAPLTGQDVAEALGATLTDDTVFLVDGGNIGQWAHFALCRDRYPSHWMTCGASAVIGWGIPGAMAARIAYPERDVLLLSGDGSIGFALAEFESAARQGLPFVAVVADDSAWGIVASGQVRAGDRCVATGLGAVDYAGVARALGGRGVRVSGVAALEAAIIEGHASGRPTLVQVPVAPGGPADGA